MASHTFYQIVLGLLLNKKTNISLSSQLNQKKVHPIEMTHHSLC